MKHKKNNDPFKLIKTFFDLNDDSQNVPFSEICKFIRKTLNLTQSEMATKFSITLQGYCFWETGKREPSSKAAFNLCLIYLQAMEVKKMNSSLQQSELLSLLNKLNVFDELKHPFISSENSSLSSNEF